TVVPETEYTNPVVPVQLDSSTTPIAVERMRATLPRDCDNQPVVQLRWTTRRISSGVNGPSFAVDSVRVFSTNVGLDGLGSMLTLRWLGQDADGGHLVDAGNTIVSGWEVLDATGRSIGASGAGHRSAGGRVRI